MQDDYRAWELPHRDAPKPVAPRVSVPFNAETSYHDTYHAHPLEAPTRHHAEPWKGVQLIPPLSTLTKNRSDMLQQQLSNGLALQVPALNTLVVTAAQHSLCVLTSSCGTLIQCIC